MQFVFMVLNQVILSSKTKTITYFDNFITKKGENQSASDFKQLFQKKNFCLPILYIVVKG